MENKDLNIAFFGTSEFSRIILERLREAGFGISVVICAPDKPRGRGLKMAKPGTKIWAEENGVKFLQPQKLDADFLSEFSSFDFQLIVVASYGKIIPASVLEIPKYKSINVHPSFLPKYRGPSPIQAQILNDEEKIGVTIMLMDEKMDHGPILSQRKASVSMPAPFAELTPLLAKEGAKLLIETIPDYVSDKIKPREQEHEGATFCKMVRKEDGLLNLDDEPRKNYLKFLALSPWPGTYYFQKTGGKDARIKITDAVFEDGKFLIKKIIPDGRREMNYGDFARNARNENRAQ